MTKEQKEELIASVRARLSEEDKKVFDYYVSRTNPHLVRLLENPETDWHDVLAKYSKRTKVVFKSKVDDKCKVIIEEVNKLDYQQLTDLMPIIEEIRQSKKEEYKAVVQKQMDDAKAILDSLQ